MKISHKKTAAGLLFALSLSVLFATGKKDNSKTDNTENETVEIPKEHIDIDLYINTKKADSKNHFFWKTSKASYKDSFDVLSGASKLHSTKDFRETVFDTLTKSLKTPKGLRNLCLFAVSPEQNLEKDNFQIVRDGKKLTLTFCHRDNFYRIESDEKGIISVPESFFIKLKQSSTKEEEKAEQTNNQVTEEKTDKENNPTENVADSTEDSKTAEENKVENISDGFEKDQSPQTLNAVFKGKLKASLSSDGIFTLKGRIKLTKNEIEKPATEETEENSEEQS